MQLEHVTAWWVAGLFAAYASFLSIQLMRRHLKNYTQPAIQKYIIRIALMVPVCTLSFLPLFPLVFLTLLTTNTGICDWLLAFSTIQGACVVHWLITRLVCLENSKEEGIVRTKGKFREEDRTNSRSIRTGIMLFALIPEQNVCWIVTRLVIYRRSEEKRARRGYTVKFSNHKYLSKKTEK